MIKSYSEISSPILQKQQFVAGAAAKPFFTIPNDNYTATLFIKAVAGGMIDDAKTYLSKKLHSETVLDLNKLKKIINSYDSFTCIGSSEKNRFVEKNTVKNSVLAVGKENNAILNLYMIREPDKHSPWKIYGIEREC